MIPDSDGAARLCQTSVGAETPKTCSLALTEAVDTVPLGWFGVVRVVHIFHKMTSRKTTPLVTTACVHPSSHEHRRSDEMHPPSLKDAVIDMLPAAGQGSGQLTVTAHPPSQQKPSPLPPADDDGIFWSTHKRDRSTRRCDLLSGQCGRFCGSLAHVDELDDELQDVELWLLSVPTRNSYQKGMLTSFALRPDQRGIQDIHRRLSFVSWHRSCVPS